MEIWKCLQMVYVFFSYVYSKTPACEESTQECTLDYVRVNIFKELDCPTSEDPNLIKWYYKQTFHSNWTAFPFKFCNCKDCDLPECEIKKRALRMRYPTSENEGYYKCSTNDMEHCFQLKLYACEERQEPLLFPPPRIIHTKKGRQLSIKCGADFGCNEHIAPDISWELEGQIIDKDGKYHICQRNNITNIETELMIDSVEEDDFSLSFKCVVTLGTSIAKEFNVCLTSIDEIFITEDRDIVVWIVVTALGIIFVSVFMTCILWVICPQKCFRIFTYCSCLSRIQNSPCKGDNYYDAFILHDDSDVPIAKDLQEELEEYSYKVKTSDDIIGGEGILKAFEDNIKKCSSLLVIYPESDILEEFDHQITIGKQIIMPYFVSLLVLTDRKTSYKNDSRFQKFHLKHFIFNKSNNLKCLIGWRLPKLEHSNREKQYLRQRDNSWC